MGDIIAYSSNISSGTTARWIRNSWVERDEVQAVAFDLRDGPPPEPYASFSMTSGNSDDEHFQCAYCDLSKKIRNFRGYVALLDIETCLQSVNDESADIINFRDQTLPHCGLYYLTNDLQKIQEAKTTLAFLASDRLYKIPKALARK